VGPLDPMSMVTNLEEANYPNGATAFLMRPHMWQVLRTMRAGGSTTTDGPFLFDPLRTMGAGSARMIEGVPVITTTQIPKTMIKGTGTTLTAIIAGDFSQVYLGRVGTVELALSTEAGFAQDQVHIRALYRHEVQIAEPRAFVVMPQLIG
jgi:HK97 family phage major capsid protein